MNGTGCPISQKINLNSFYENFKSILNQESLLLSDKSNDAGADVNLLAKDESAIMKVIDNCSISKLSGDTDKSCWDEIKIMRPRQVSDLKQIKSYDNFVNAFSISNNSVNQYMDRFNRKNPVTKDLSYNNKRNPDDIEAVSDSNTLVMDEMIITIVVYKPLRNYRADISPTANLFKALKPLTRVDMIGSNTLKDLVQMINCKNSESLMGDFSDLISEWQNYKVTAGQCFKGWFFFIENKFYNSLDGEDLSFPIIEWVFKDRDRTEEFGDLRRHHTDDVALKDLSVCIGKPYLFQHLGNCEHIFVISDVKLASKHNIQKPEEYPIVTGSCKYSIIKCLFCETNNAEWLVVDCPITPLEKTPLCDFCTRTFLYNENDVRSEEGGNFKLFRLPSFQ